jgi:hypothetical protein
MTCKPQQLAPTNWNTVPPDPEEAPGWPVIETLARVALLAIERRSHPKGHRHGVLDARHHPTNI